MQSSSGSQKAVGWEIGQATMIKWRISMLSEDYRFLWCGLMMVTRNHNNFFDIWTENNNGDNRFHWVYYSFLYKLGALLIGRDWKRHDQSGLGDSSVIIYCVWYNIFDNFQLFSNKRSLRFWLTKQKQRLASWGQSTFYHITHSVIPPTIF